MTFPEPWWRCVTTVILLRAEHADSSQYLTRSLSLHQWLPIMKRGFPEQGWEHPGLWYKCEYLEVILTIWYSQKNNSRFYSRVYELPSYALITRISVAGLKFPLWSKPPLQSERSWLPLWLWSHCCTNRHILPGISVLNHAVSSFWLFSPSSLPNTFWYYQS